MAKLDGKALGIVQVVGKGEGLEAWRQLKLEYEGKTGNRQAALLRGILNPRAGWEADARDGRSVVESLNSWERPSASIGVNISDGILAATVLEHSPENYQNILEQAPSNVRASHSAVRGWLREYAETLRRYDGTSGFSSQQTQSTGPVPMEVDQTRAVSGFHSGKSSDGKGKAIRKGKSKDGKGKGKGKKGAQGAETDGQERPSGINGFTSPGQRERQTFVYSEVCGLDPDKPRPQPPQAQGCATERSSDHRPEDCTHVSGTDKWKTGDGSNGHIPSRGGAGQYLVAGKAGQERFQFLVWSPWLLDGEGRQVSAALPGKE